MNIDDYIASGKLESYAMGCCSDAEKAEVESMLALYPALQEELRQIQESVEKYGDLHAVAPSSRVRQAMMDQISNSSSETPVLPLRPVGHTSNNRMKWMAAASVILLIGSMASNMMLYNKYREVQSHVLALEDEKTQLADNLQKTKTSFDQTNQALAAINHPQTMMIEMKAMPMAPESKAMVFYNRESADVYLSIAELPDAPSNMQYQFWVIVDGVARDAGMIDLEGNDGMPHKMKGFENATAFVVSLEKKGGSPTPNMEAIYVMGAVES